MRHFIFFFLGVIFIVTGSALLLTPVYVALRHGGACNVSVPVLVSGVGLLVFTAMLWIPTDTRTALDYGIGLFRQVKP